MPFCTKCGNKLSDADSVCPACGSPQGQGSTAPKNVAARVCPFCRQQVDASASRCPHCAAEIGRLQDCVPCPRCNELVKPMSVTGTDEKGMATDIAKIALGGQAYLSGAEETYTACPACKTPIAYCPNCRKLTISSLKRQWVGVGRTKSGYQFAAICSICGGRSAGPSCFVATSVFQTTLDANLLDLYLIRDRWLTKSKLGRGVVTVYYAFSPAIAAYCKKNRYLRLVTMRALMLMLSLWRARRNAQKI